MTNPTDFLFFSQPNVRSLLASEALVDDLGVAIDAQVIDSLGVGRVG